MTMTAKTSTSSTPSSAAADPNSRYTCSPEALAALRQSSPWKNDPKYFKSAALSPSAVLQMLSHCQSGVTKGISKGGNPIEVMGLLLGRPDPVTPHTLIVTDAFPLPIEGFETRVIADDVDVINHMIALGESLEQTRREKFMGWYHSHPFDLSENSHCFLSQTDISTQLQWQRAEDPHGNPFLAIVIDPLRSIAQNYPELKAFRAYPPEYTNPIPNECPDGTVIQEEQARLEKWGSCATSYYELRVECYMSRGARNVLGLLNRKSLWMKGLVAGQQQLQQQQQQKKKKMVGGEIEQVDGVAKVIGRYDPIKLRKGSAAAAGGGASGSLLDERLSSIQPPSSSAAGGMEKLKGEETEEGKDELGKACQELVQISTEQLVGDIAQMSKKELFSSLAL